MTTTPAPEKIPVIFDMETQDPDDYLTLLLLIGHPGVDLRAVTITPGSAYQVGLVRATLARFGLDLPVGANNIEHPKTCVSSWHEDAYHKIHPSQDAEPGGELLHRMCSREVTLITGAPLKNLGDAMTRPGFELGRLVAQGGFAGEGVVPAEKQLPKFKGMVTCPTFNLNGAPRAALEALQHPGIGERFFVSKNVCHGVVYTEAFHRELGAVKEGREHLEQIWRGMEYYLAKKRARAGVHVELSQAVRDDQQVRLVASKGFDAGIYAAGELREFARDHTEDIFLATIHEGHELPVCKLVTRQVAHYGKKLHDPLAACCAIERSIGVWVEVEMFRKRGGWGARLANDTNTFIITDYDPELFFEVFSRSL